ncbi:MAG: CooT family nickel-binding protein [Candidatus Hydrothermarchaeales archaeon]
MCESAVYLVQGGRKEKIMDEAISIEDKDGRLIVVGVLGEREEIPRGRIIKMDMGRHEILVTMR